MKRVLFLLVAVGAFTLAWAADVAKEMDAAAQVLQNMTSSNQIPASLISQAKCIAVIPKLTKGGFIVGGEHGNGAISCRTGSGWSAPAFTTMTGGSVGFQAGAEHQDIVLLMNDKGEQELSSGHWDLSAEAVVAGPTSSTGRTESTGWKAPVLSYTHASGAYAGANLEGSKLNADRTRSITFMARMLHCRASWMAKHRLQHPPRSSWLPYLRLGNSLEVPLINQLASELVLQYARRRM